MLSSAASAASDVFTCLCASRTTGASVASAALAVGGVAGTKQDDDDCDVDAADDDYDNHYDDDDEAHDADFDDDV